MRKTPNPQNMYDGVDDLEGRFYRWVDRCADNECWAWRGARSPAGYGYFKGKGLPRVASRMAWQLHNGEIPGGMDVCHKCDNPGCVNLRHLFLGTDQDNADDKLRKHREYHPISDETVIEIGERRLRGERITDIAKAIGVSENAASLLSRGYLQGVKKEVRR